MSLPRRAKKVYIPIQQFGQTRETTTRGRVSLLGAVCALSRNEAYQTGRPNEPRSAVTRVLNKRSPWAGTGRRGCTRGGVVTAGARVLLAGGLSAGARHCTGRFSFCPLTMFKSLRQGHRSPSLSSLVCPTHSKSPYTPATAPAPAPTEPPLYRHRSTHTFEKTCQQHSLSLHDRRRGGRGSGGRYPGARRRLVADRDPEAEVGMGAGSEAEGEAARK